MSFLTVPLLTAALIATIYATVVVVVRSFSTSSFGGFDGVKRLVFTPLDKHCGKKDAALFFLAIFSVPVLIFFWVVPTVQAFSHRQAAATQGPRIDAEITRLQQESAQFQREADSETASLVPVYDDLAKRKLYLTAR